MNKRFGAAAVVVAAVTAAAGSLASTSSGSAQTQPAIGMIVAGSGSPTAPEEVSGGQSAAAALGDTLAVSATDDPAGAIDSLIAEHVAAIAVQTGTEDPLIDRALGRARSAGIPTLALEGRSANAIWVSQSGSAQYAHALADALASQMHRRGQFITVPCDSGFRIVKTWTDDADAYIQHRYARMHRVAIVVGGTGNGPAGTIVIRPLLKKYPHLRGFIFICPGESYEGPPQLVHAHKVGKVFTAGNGGDCPPLYIKLAKSVRAGSVEIVCAGDPTNLGYLAIWAADHLARNHTLTLTPGSYDVGGPVGTVQYYSQNQELRLGQPLTITKANVDQYAGKPCPPETPWPC
jgi:ABC-type sugar transport system substrate-binding protein